MLAILRLGKNAYDVTIHEKITSQTERQPSPGVLYLFLDRLEEKGVVRSRFGDPTPQRGGRAKRFSASREKEVESVARARRPYQRLLRDLNLPGDRTCVMPK